MNPIAIGAIVEGVGKIADDLITSEEERRRADLEDRKVDAGLAQGQIEVNKAEAQHPSIWVAGGRPAIIWVGAFALAWTFIAHPILMWAWKLAQSQGAIPVAFDPPPTLGDETLWVILSGVLGIGTMRTFEKTKRVDTRRIGSADDPGQIGGP